MADLCTVLVCLTVARSAGSPGAQVLTFLCVHVLQIKPICLVLRFSAVFGPYLSFLLNAYFIIYLYSVQVSKILLLPLNI